MPIDSTRLASGALPRAENRLGLEPGAAGRERSAILDRHEAPELRRPRVAVQPLHGRDLDDGTRNPERGERQRNLATEPVEVDRRTAPNGDSRPSRCLAHLVLDHAGAATERGA